MVQSEVVNRLAVNRVRTLFLMSCWLMAYTVGPFLHDPVSCVGTANKPRAGCSHAHGVTDNGFCGQSTSSTPHDDADEASDCEFCRILSVPYQVAENAVRAARGAAFEALAALPRLQPVFSRYGGFSFGARAPPSV